MIDYIFSIFFLIYGLIFYKFKKYNIIIHNRVIIITFKYIKDICVCFHYRLFS